MWKWLHPYANPEVSYHFVGKLLPWISKITFVLLSIGIVWALAFAPADYQQGDSFRIFYVHVPTAILSMSIYIAMASAAFCSLVWQFRLADASAAAMAPVGAVITAIALFTGAAWGKPMWGTWWIWDARLTSELVLLFLYLGVIALHNAFEDKNLAGKAAGILSLVGVVNIPIIKYSVEWWNTLHQPASVATMEGPKIHSSILTPLLIMGAAYMSLFVTVFIIRVKAEILDRRLRMLRLVQLED